MTDYTDTTILWLTGRKKEIRDDLLHTGFHDFRSTCNCRNSKRLTVMFEVMNVDDEFTISSLDFLKNFINPARVAAGEEVWVRHNDFLARVKDELEGQVLVTKLFTPKLQGRGGNRKPFEVVDLNMDQMLLVGMRESKAVRKAVLAKLKKLQQTHQPQPLLQLQCEIGELHKQNDELRNEIEVDRKTYDLLLVDMKKLREEKENLQKELTALRKQDDVRKRALKLLLGL